jgi:hypothetical protein
VNKSKILLGFVGQPWEQHIVAELDSALNKWVDSVPDYRVSHGSPFLFFTYVTTSILQYAGTPTEKTITFSINPYFFTWRTTTFRSPSTARSYRRGANLRPSLFHRSRYVPTPHAHVVTSLISRGRGTLIPHLKFLFVDFGFQRPFVF